MWCGVARRGGRVQPSDRHHFSQPIDLRRPPVDAHGRPSRVLLYDSSGREEGVGAPQPRFRAWIVVSSLDGFHISIKITPVCTVCNELAMPVRLKIRHAGGEEQSPGALEPGQAWELHSFAPSDSVFLWAKLPGFAWSKRARVQADPKLPTGSTQAELHSELECSDARTPALSLTVHINNFVVRERTGEKRDRRVTLSCPFWIQNLTGLPLSFCTGSPIRELADSAVSLPPQASRMLERVEEALPPSARNFDPGAYLPALPALSTPRAASARDLAVGAAGDAAALLPGQAAFHEEEARRGTASKGLVEQPLRTGDDDAGAVAAAGPAPPSLMLSFPQARKRVLFAKLAGTQWSHAIPVNEGGASGLVEVSSESQDPSQVARGAPARTSRRRCSCCARAT